MEKLLLRRIEKMKIKCSRFSYPEVSNKFISNSYFYLNRVHYYIPVLNEMLIIAIRKVILRSKVINNDKDYFDKHFIDLRNELYDTIKSILYKGIFKMELYGNHGVIFRICDFNGYYNKSKNDKSLFQLSIHIDFYEISWSVSRISNINVGAETQCDIYFDYVDSVYRTIYDNSVKIHYSLIKGDYIEEIIRNNVKNFSEERNLYDINKIGY